MKAAVRDKEDATLPRRVREPADVGQELLRSGHVEFALGKHKIGLRVHFPKNDFL